MFYRLEGKDPVLCTAEELGVWMEENRRTIACDTDGDLCISTVFLGVDHSRSENPLLFETMVFKERDPIDMQRYVTWEEAELGHKILVEKYKKVEKGKRQREILMIFLAAFFFTGQLVAGYFQVVYG